MSGIWAAFAMIGCLMILETAVTPPARGQDFPFLVPQAPEFNSRGQQTEPRGPQNLAAPYPEPRPQRGSPGPVNRDMSTYRVRRPDIPPEPMTTGPTRRGTLQAAPQVAPQAPPQRPATPNPYSGQSYLGQAPPPRPDCSQYPMAIAQARTEEEMRMAARLYLTCLMENGWSQEQARNHVISVVETSYRHTR
jgi:hypothetical protein